jgi:hypothetical protein
MYYDYALILGATVSRMEARLSFLAQEWERGVRFRKLVFLSGERILNPAIESFPMELNTESQALVHLFNHLDLPEGMKALPLEIIDSPARLNAKGDKRRPTTKDTLVDWLKRNPDAGSCLFISNQPYIGYQDAVCRTELPLEFIIETIGPESFSNTTFAQYLDNLAKWLYQEKKANETHFSDPPR